MPEPSEVVRALYSLPALERAAVAARAEKSARQQLRRARIGAVRQCRDQGMTYRTIGLLLGLSAERVRQLAKDA